MSLDNTAVVPALPTGGSSYTIDQSLRFDDGDGGALKRTFGSGGDRQTWTFSAWVKRSSTDDSTTPYYLFEGYQSGDGSLLDRIGIRFRADNIYVLTSSVYVLVTNAKFSDLGAWYHIVVACDTTQGVNSNRMKLYVNGEQVTSFSTTNYPAQNANLGINQAAPHWVGRSVADDTGSFNGYMAEVNFVDGQQLDATSFGETGTYGEWKPIEYSGSYGTTGFYLDFSGTYYNDQSGNSNNFTASNLATTDVVLDSPTNNFATLDGLRYGYTLNGASLSQGNLIYSGGSDWGYAVSTIAVPKDKKIYVETMSANGNGYQGVIRADFNSFSGGSRLDGYAKGLVSEYIDSDTLIVYYERDADGNGGQSTVSGSGFQNTNQVKGMLIDQANSTVKFYRGGSLVRTEVQPDAFNTTDDYVIVVAGGYSSNYPRINFGQDSSFAGTVTAQGNTDANGYGDFYYDPTSFDSNALALCTANLDDPAVVPNENFKAVTYTGAGNGTSITGVGFQADLGWFANRAGDNQPIYDVQRGTNRLYSNLGNAESSGTFVSFDTDGFTVNADGEIGDSGANYAAWLWKANNTTGSSNTNGSITSTVSANQDAGFSIVTYTGTGSASNYGHGLTKAPEMSFHFRRNSTTGNNYVWHKKLQAGGEIYLNSGGQGYVAYSSNLTPTLPTNTLFYVGPGGDQNLSGGNFVVYHFHSVEGFSKIGDYDGRFSVGATGNNLIYTGFRPAFVMVKCYTAGENWVVFDNERQGYNDDNRILRPNSTSAEATDTNYLEIYSNGFSASYGTGEMAVSGKSFLYIAFAEQPFKYANAR